MVDTQFRRLNQVFLSSPAGYIPSFLATNIKVVDWLPQNDLLAHKDIKAFVSHVGHNSFYESAYHGVPVVAVPIFGDQQSNAKKAEHVGFGLAVDLKTSNAQQLFETIERVINEPRYNICFVYSCMFGFCIKLMLSKTPAFTRQNGKSNNTAQNDSEKGATEMDFT